MRLWRISVGIALAALVLALGACGGDDEESESAATPESTPTETATPAESGGGGETLALSAPEDGSLKFDQAELTAPAGEVTIDFDNPSSVPHAVEVEGNGVEKAGEVVTNKKAPPLTVELEPGTYEYYCPVGNHQQAGMEGTLTVE